MKNLLYLLLSCLLAACSTKEPAKNYHFDENGITREVLENYLDRSITLSCVLAPKQDEASLRVHRDDIRMIKNIGVKFIGRAIFRWENEAILNDPTFWSHAQKTIEELHAYDPDIIFQGCLFEAISEEVNQIAIPEWVFTTYGLPVEKRNFSYDKMLDPNGRYVDHWHKGGSVPDISQTETQLWFLYLAGSYINIGCEAFHLGQIELIGMNDPERDDWKRWIDHIRAYAREHARRHWVLLDAHTPKGDMLKEGVSLLDFNSFPLRICAVPGNYSPEEPQYAELRMNHLDALFGRSKGGVTPSGWSCENLPYLVEIDNYGHEEPVNVADTTSYFPWGWDEISWYAKQPETYRNEWLQYAWNWLKENDPNGHFEMPGLRGICCPNETNNTYRANTRSEACPLGYSQEETIKAIWNQ